MLAVICSEPRQAAVYLAGGQRSSFHQPANGGWQEKVIHNFGNGIKRLSVLSWRWSAGRLRRQPIRYDNQRWHVWPGCRFQLSPSLSGSWTEKILHSFEVPKARMGDTPNTGLVFGPSGALYGVTNYGGTYNEGLSSK